MSPSQYCAEHPSDRRIVGIRPAREENLVGEHALDLDPDEARAGYAACVRK